MIIKRSYKYRIYPNQEQQAALALFIVSNFVWAWYGIAGGVWSIVGLQCVFLGLNVRAWRRGS